MDALFPTDRSLLYPQFETYRLESLDPDQDVVSYPLPGKGATQSRVGYNTHLLSFKEVQSRIEWNHLSTGCNGRGVYIDEEWNVVGVQATVKEDLVPRITTLLTLPTPPTKDSLPRQAEYPSAVEIDRTHWTVADGAGTLFILETSSYPSPFTAQVVSRHTPTCFRNTESQGSSSTSSTPRLEPFLIQGVRRNSGASPAGLILSFAHPVGKGQKGSTSTSTTTTFELCETRLHRNAEAGPSETGHYFGTDLPLIVDSTQSGESGPSGWIALCAKEFVEPELWSQTLEKDEERRKRERLAEGSHAGLGAAPEQGEAAGSSAVGTSDLGIGQSIPKAEGAHIEEIDEDEKMEDPDSSFNPYSWTQHDDSLALSIALPPSTSRQDFTVTLTDGSFSLELSSTISSNSSVALQRFLSRIERRWWGDVDSSESTFTYDAAKCVLDIELSKRDTNVRWPSVFAPVSEDDGEEDLYEEVPETFDSATLAAVRDTFGKIKRRASDADGDEPTGNHPAMPALLREEMDYDLDDEEDFDEAPSGVFGDAGGQRIGREVLVGHLCDANTQWSRSSTTVISLPISGKLEEGVIIKSAVDGLLFVPDTKSDKNPARSAWKHVSTSPALSFVLSSKRDLRFVRHVTTKDSTGKQRATVLAFDSGATPGGGNVYVYYPAVDKVSAKQGLVKVSGGERGALLGVGAVEVGGKKVVLALCEKALVVLKGVLRD